MLRILVLANGAIAVDVTNGLQTQFLRFTGFAFASGTRIQMSIIKSRESRPRVGSNGKRLEQAWNVPSTIGEFIEPHTNFVEQR